MEFEERHKLSGRIPACRSPLGEAEGSFSANRYPAKR